MQLQTELSDITGFWEAEIDTAVEAGREPLLVLGHSLTALRPLTGLLAFEQWAAYRTDISTVRVAMGGPAPLWISTVVGARAGRHEVQPIYLGEDPATVIATLNLVTTQTAMPSTRRLPAPGHVPPGYAPFVLPAAHPAAPLPWDALPFTRMQAARAAAGVDGTALAALFLAVALIFFAFLL